MTLTTVHGSGFAARALMRSSSSMSASASSERHVLAPYGHAYRGDEGSLPLVRGAWRGRGRSPVPACHTASRPVRLTAAASTVRRSSMSPSALTLSDEVGAVVAHRGDPLSDDGVGVLGDGAARSFARPCRRRPPSTPAVADRAEHRQLLHLWVLG